MRLDPLDYRILIQDALRGVVRRSLEIVAAQGLPGDHHFYLAFRTGAPGVVMPEHLKERYPEEMTIVLKTQFRDLDVSDDAFSVGLFFGGVLHYLIIPFAALLSFTDPAVDFQVVFHAEPARDDDSTTVEIEAPGDPSPAAEQTADNVVSLSGFRRKKEAVSPAAGRPPDPSRSE